MPERIKGGRNIPVPHDRSKPLAARIGCTGQRDDIRFSLALQPVIIRLRVIKRIDQPDLRPVSNEELEVAKLLWMHVRLRLVEPEGLDPIVIVALLGLLPDKLPRLRIRWIDIGYLSAEIK